MTPMRLALAYALDLVVGDPEWFPHPVRFFGALIRKGERWLRRTGSSPQQSLRRARLSPAPWCRSHGPQAAAEHRLASLARWTALATRSLLNESRSVLNALETGEF